MLTRVVFFAFWLLLFAVLQTLSASTDKTSVAAWMATIKDLYANNVVACVYFLQKLLLERPKLVDLLLVKCPVVPCSPSVHGWGS